MKEIRCNTGEIVYSYDDYLKTKHWKNIKEAYKKEYKYICTMCDQTKDLHLHHMTYENIGHEKLTDLVYLCKTCHHKIHQALDAEKTKVLGSLAEKLSKNKKVKANCEQCFHFNKRTHACKLYGLNMKPTKCKNYYPQLFDPKKNPVTNAPKSEMKRILSFPGVKQTKGKNKKKRSFNIPKCITTYENFSEKYKITKTSKDLILLYEKFQGEDAYFVKKKYRFYVNEINPLVIVVKENSAFIEECIIIEKTHAT